MKSTTSTKIKCNVRNHVTLLQSLMHPYVDRLVCHRDIQSRRQREGGGIDQKKRSYTFCFFFFLSYFLYFLYRKGAEETARMVKEAGAARGGVSEGFFFAMDATNRASVDAAVAAVVEKYGGLDISVSVIGGGYVCLHSHARYITPHCIARHLCICASLFCIAVRFFSSFLHFFILWGGHWEGQRFIMYYVLTPLCILPAGCIRQYHTRPRVNFLEETEESYLRTVQLTQHTVQKKKSPFFFPSPPLWRTLLRSELCGRVSVLRNVLSREISLCTF